MLSRLLLYASLLALQPVATVFGKQGKSDIASRQTLTHDPRSDHCG